MFVFAAFHIPLTWGDLLKRTAKDTVEDDCLGQAAQLAYYFFLALFPAVLFLLALASFLPLDNFIDQLVGTLRPIAPREMLEFLETQLRRVSNTDSSGILTMGILGAVWSSSAALVAIVNSLNRAYDIEEARPWWKVRLTAIGLTLALATFVLIAFALIIVGPMLAERLAVSFGLGAAFEWTWKILQWPLAFFLVSTAVGLVYYFGPDAEQDWLWVTPGAVLGTLLWMLVSLIFKFYVANFADYNATYGAVGGVIVLLLWFYISGLAILVGAEMNAEIEHASPHGKNPGEEVPGQRRKIGTAAARAFKERLKAVTMTQGESSMATTNTTINNNERTLGEMFADLSRETRTLIQQEIRLARSELSEKASHITKGAGLVVVGGLTVYGGLLAVIAAAVLVLIVLGIAPWAGALLVGILAIGGGCLLVRSGLASLNPRELVPHNTIETIKEDAEWLKNQAR